MADTRGQLCLTRRVGQEVVLLGADGAELARVAVVGVGRGRVELATKAAAAVTVCRGEVAEGWRPRAQVVGHA